MNVIEFDRTTVSEFESKPSQSLCPNCGDLYEYRSNKSFCSTKCRKAHHKLGMRDDKAKAVNKTLPSEQRQNLELLHLNFVLCEKVYTMPPEERVGYVESVLQVALYSEGGLLRHLLSNKKYQYPNPNDLRLFFRGAPKSYKTFPQICNHYLLNSPWNCYLSDFLKGTVPEPSTGEVLSDGTIDVRINAHSQRADALQGSLDLAPGWKPAVAGHRQKGKGKGKVKRVQTGPEVDPNGRYVNYWYYDGQSHRAGAWVAICIPAIDPEFKRAN